MSTGLLERGCILTTVSIQERNTTEKIFLGTEKGFPVLNRARVDSSKTTIQR